MASQKSDSCVVVWIAPNQLGVAKKGSGNRLQWLKKENDLSFKLVIDDSFQLQRYDPAVLLAEGPMPLRGLQDDMIATVLNNFPCVKDKLLFLKQLEPFLLPISYKFWSEKLATPLCCDLTLDEDDAQERPFKRRSILRNTLLTMKADCLFLMFSFLIPANKIILNVLKACKLLYNCRADVFSNCSVQMYSPLAYLSTITDFNPRNLTLYNNRFNCNNFIALHLKILQKMTKLKNLTLMLYSEVSLESLEHVSSLHIEGWDDKRAVQLPKNLISLTINAINRISRINGVYSKLEELNIATDSKLGKEVRFEGHQFPALRNLDVTNCNTIYALPYDLATSLQVLRTRTSFSFKELARLENLQVLHVFKIFNDFNDGGLQSAVGAKLKDLKLESFHSSNLDDLASFTSLVSLRLSSSSMLRDINGIVEMPLLQSLALMWCPLITSIDCLSKLLHLSEFRLFGCPSVKDISVVSVIFSLRMFECDTLNDLRLDQIQKIQVEKPHLVITVF